MFRDTGRGDGYARCMSGLRQIDSPCYSPRPPTALVTDTAAVKTPSAIVKPVPKRAYVMLGVIARAKRKIVLYPYQQGPSKALWWPDVKFPLSSSHHRVVSRGSLEKFRGVDALIQCERPTLA